MAQFLTALGSSCAVNPSVTSQPVKTVQKLSSGCRDYGNFPSFIKPGSSLNPLSRSIRASSGLGSKRFMRFRCSASGGQKGNVIEVKDEESMEKYLREAGDKLVVIDISTTSCGPCKLIYPKLVKMSIEYPDVLFLKINGDLSSSTRALMRKWGVKAVPNFRFYKGGELLHSHTGANEDELRAHFLTHYVGVQSIVS